MKEWFYVKNDLKAREDIKEIIMRPIWQRFGLRKPKVEFDEAAEECQKAFDIVSSFIQSPGHLFRKVGMGHLEPERATKL